MYLHLSFRVCFSPGFQQCPWDSRTSATSCHFPGLGCKKYSNSDKLNPNQNSTTRSAMSTINVFNSDK